MKKTILTIVCLLGLLGVNAQTAKIALQHNGNVTLYDYDKMPEVMTACVDGDTVYVNEGTFPNDFTISKKISIIGSGEASILTGKVTVNIPGTPTLTAHLLDALWVKNSIIFSAPTKGAKIRKCQFTSINFNATTEDATIDRCYCRSDYFYLSTWMKNINIINSKIYRIRGAAANANDVNLINCNIYSFYSSTCIATYMNCIIASLSSSSNATTIYNNCLCGNSFYTQSVNQNCWNCNSTNILNDNVNCILDDSQLQSNGYIGTDGTVVGITGGTTPYTLVPTVPKVTEYTIGVDTDKKKLNVNLKVTAN